LKERIVLIPLFFFLFALCAPALVCPAAQGQSGLGGSNLFNNSGMIDSGPGTTGNPFNALNQLGAPKIPIGKGKPAAQEKENEDDWQPAYLQPFPIAYLNIPQLAAPTREILSQSYFVAINGPTIKSFSQLYKNNRLENISSFITADSVVHPLLSFQNSIRLTVIEQSVTPLLKSLLIAMAESGRQDYLAAEDAETKEEIKNNLAFLLVAITILQPDYAIPNMPGIKQLVESELNSIKQKRFAYSTIFHRQINFALLEPVGWRKVTPAAEQFFMCCQWLSSMGLELSDAEGQDGNEFRRAFLLFQSLMKASITDGHKENEDNGGYASWQKINEILGLLNLNRVIDDKDNIERVLPSNFASIFPSAKSASRITLNSLSDPLNRTKLFLTLKSNAPRKQLNATSIFALNKDKASGERQLQFCLLNPLDQPAAEDCFQAPVYQKDAAAGFSLTPIGLILAESKGIVWSKRILGDNASKLSNQAIEGTNGDRVVTGAFWQVFKTLSSGYIEPAPQVLQTKQWRTFCVERQIAAWVDKMLSSGVGAATPLDKDNNTEAKNGENKSADKVGTINSVIRKFGIPSWRTINTFNYLEPAATVYGQLAESQSNFEHSLTQSNLFPSQYAERSHDFIRLFKRLTAIANAELNNQIISMEDQSLLAGIDKVLQVIEPPLLGNLYIPFGGSSSEPDLAAAVVLGDQHSSKMEAKSKVSSKKSDDASIIRLSDSTETSKSVGRFIVETETNQGVKLAGVNMGLGYPTCVYVIVMFKRCYYLMRGAAYSYHEQTGSAINSKNWQRQLDMGFFMDPPFWCESFQRLDK